MPAACPPTRAALAAVLLAVLLGATACSSTSVRAASRSAAPTPTEAVQQAAVPSGSPSPEAAGEDDDLVLQGDGLSLLQGDTPQPLPFATAAAADVRAALTAALGDLTETADVACPQGPRSALSADGFTALLAGDRLVGWTDHGAPDRAFTTADGVGTGTRLPDLRSALPDVQVPAGGTTWSSAGGLSGTLSGSDPAATVTAVSAGETCPAAPASG